MSSTDKRDTTTPRAGPSLREKAEAKFHLSGDGSPERIDALTPMSIRTLVHELQVHQIELEMQNDELRRVQAELEASRGRYFDLYDMAPVGYVTVSEAGLIREANLTASTLLGVARTELVRRPLSRFIAKEDQDIYYQHQRKLFEAGEPQQCELRMIKPDGTLVWTHLSSTAGHDEAGERACRVVLNDIADRRRAEVYRQISSEVLRVFLHSEDLASALQRIQVILKLQTGFDAVGIRLQDGEDFPYFVQEGFSESFLRRENSLLARTTSGDVCRNSDGEACLECVCGVILSGQADPSNPLFTKGGSFWTNDSASLLKTPAERDPWLHTPNQCVQHGYASIALIPIRTKERTTGLIQLNDRRKGRLTLEIVEILEGLAAHIGEALMRKKVEMDRNEALRRAEDEARAKNDFLAVMSHELRTPLNGVIGFADLLGDTPLNTDQKSLLQTITSSGHHLLSLVNDVLDYASMEHGALTIEVAPVVVAKLAGDSFLPLRQTAADKGIELRTEIAPGVPEMICVDGRRVRQILLNLLNNAVKFTSKGSVVLRIAPTGEAARNCLDFSIEDSGSGISHEMLARLFRPFSQADSKLNRAYGGCGLGLSISKRLAEAMGGSISVVSTVDQGSTFTFRLPLEAPPFAASLAGQETPPSIGASAAAHVLVVDDDEVSRQLAGKTLQVLGYEPDFAADGDEAVRAFSPGKYSAIFMDVSMPRLDGLGATQKIREIERATRGHVPIIALTANVLPGGRERCLAAGMDDFLSKPFKRDELAAKLAGVVLR